MLHLIYIPSDFTSFNFYVLNRIYFTCLLWTFITPSWLSSIFYLYYVNFYCYVFALIYVPLVFCELLFPDLKPYLQSTYILWTVSANWILSVSYISSVSFHCPILYFTFYLHSLIFHRDILNVTYISPPSSENFYCHILNFIYYLLLTFIC